MNSNSKHYNKNEGISLDEFVMPTDHQAERQLIACLLDQPRLMSDALELLGTKDIITHEGYQLLFGILCNLYSEGRSIKVGTVLQQLSADGKTVKLLEMGISLLTLPAEAHTVEFADTCVHLRSLWIKRQALESAGEIISAVRSCEPAGQVVDLLTKAAESVSAGLTVNLDQSITDVIAQTLSAIDFAMSKPGQLTGINTGLGKLNRNLGGWQDSDIIVIAGRPGMGKSVAGIVHTLAAAREGIAVAFLSLEMPAKSLMNRIIAHETSIPYSRIKKGNLSEDEKGQIHRAVGLIERLPIHFYDEPNTDINDLTYLLIRWKKRYNIGLVVIDYVQKMKDRTIKSNDDFQVLTSVSDKLQKLQRRLACPIIELAQLNRGVENRTSKRAGMADLRSTGQFEQDASVIIMLYRDDYYKEKAARERSEETGAPYEEPDFDNQLEYGIVKSRDGETGTAVFWADVATNRIADDEPTISAPTGFPATNTDSWYNPTDTVNF